MQIGNSNNLAYLRNLPSNYLLDLLAEGKWSDEHSIYLVLKERGYGHEEIETKVNSLRESGWPTRVTLWRIARWASLVNAAIVLLFNLIGFYRFLHSDHEFTFMLFLLSVSAVSFGFFLGYKMTSHVYLGGQSTLYCGFPVPIGYVNLESGEQIAKEATSLILRMAINAIVGISFTAFPLMLLFVWIQ